MPRFSFFIQSDNLSLLIGTFIPLTFIMMADIFGLWFYFFLPILLFLCCFGLFPCLLSVFSFSCFSPLLDYKLYSISFFLTGYLEILPSILNKVPAPPPEWFKDLRIYFNFSHHSQLLLCYSFLFYSAHSDIFLSFIIILYMQCLFRFSYMFIHFFVHLTSSLFLK